MTPAIQLVLIAVPALLFLVTYIRRTLRTTPWWRHPEGRFLVGFPFSVLLFACNGAAFRFFGEYPGYEAIRFTLFMAVQIIIWYLYYMLRTSDRRARELQSESQEDS